jgi:hypothetical protein
VTEVIGFAISALILIIIVVTVIVKRDPHGWIYDAAYMYVFGDVVQEGTW